MNLDDAEAFVHRQVARLTSMVESPRDVIASWKPRPEDYGRVFTDDVADTVREQVEALFDDPPDLSPGDGPWGISIALATVPDLRTGEGGARAMAGGYRDVADKLVPGPLWAGWTFIDLEKKAKGPRYDGLVLLDEDRLVWFPKAHKHLLAAQR